MFRNIFITSLIFLWFSASYAAGSTEFRALLLPGHGVFKLPVQKSWKSSIEQPPDNLPPTITFSEPSGATFRVLVTPIWQFRKDTPLPEGEGLRELVQHAADQAQKSASNKISLQKLGSTGYWYLAVDPAPKPDEWKFMTQGMARVGDLMVTFTALTNDGQEVTSFGALFAVQNAVHVP